MNLHHPASTATDRGRMKRLRLYRRNVNGDEVVVMPWKAVCRIFNSRNGTRYTQARIQQIGNGALSKLREGLRDFRREQ